jgi:hypothetical protein
VWAAFSLFQLWMSLSEFEILSLVNIRLGLNAITVRFPDFLGRPCSSRQCRAARFECLHEGDTNERSCVPSSRREISSAGPGSFMRLVESGLTPERQPGRGQTQLDLAGGFMAKRSGRAFCSLSRTP